MSHFYGTVRGGRGEATRCGHKTTGLVTNAAGYKGSIRTEVWYDEVNQEDRFSVSLTPWQGSGGQSRSIASGTLNADIGTYRAKFLVQTAMNGIQFALKALDSVKY